jgi:polyisoprenoid-binding protein YceI
MSVSKWDFDLVHSSVNFHVRHLMVSKVHGRFQKWGGTLELDDTDLTKSRIDIQIDASSVDTKEEKRDAHLRSADFLDVEQFPTIQFTSKSIEKDGDTYRVTGDITIHGITKQVVLDVEGGEQVKDPWGGTRTGFSAKAKLNRKDFGLTWNLALEAGGFVVGDKLEISIEVEAVKAAASVGASSAA